MDRIEYRVPGPRSSLHPLTHLRLDGQRINLRTVRAMAGVTVRVAEFGGEGDCEGGTAGRRVTGR